MRRAAIIVAGVALGAFGLLAAACRDKGERELADLKDQACACTSYVCIAEVEVALQKQAADWKDPKRPAHAKHLAEELVACLSDVQTKLDGDAARAIEAKLHGVDSPP